MERWVKFIVVQFLNLDLQLFSSPSGMVKELQEREADMGITDFTITSSRQSAVDFSMPFMNLGISILYKKPEEKTPELFQFMKPFSLEVWLYTASALIAVTISSHFRIFIYFVINYNVYLIFIFRRASPCGSFHVYRHMNGLNHIRVKQIPKSLSTTFHSVPAFGS